MDKLIHLTPKKLHLLLALRPQRGEMMNALVALSAAAGPVRVLDGGNSFNAYGLARLLRQKCPDWQAALERTWTSRAFTCHQMSTLLAETGALPQPTLVLDMLDTFYDENVPLPERLRLLDACLKDLHRLAQVAAVAVSAAPLKARQPAEFLERLKEAAGQVWHFEILPPPAPWRLF